MSVLPLISVLKFGSECDAQAGLALMVNPPKEGDPSHEQHEAEAAGIIASMRRRARMMTDGFNACEGITCNYTEGAMYSFPRLNLPPKVRSHFTSASGFYSS